MKATTSLLRNNAPSHNLHWRISLMLVAWDVIAVVYALYLAQPLASWLAFLAGHPLLPLDAFSIAGHSYIFFALSVVVLLTFANKGHYTRRVPWWGQIEFILKAAFLAFLVDGFLSFTLRQSYSPLMVTSAWASLTLLLVLCRRIALYFASRMSEWQLPTVLLADAPTAMEAFHALCGDGETGYKVHTILLCGDSQQPFDMGALPRSCEPPRHVLEGIDYTHYIISNPYDFYLLALDGLNKRQQDELIHLLDVYNIQYALVPSPKRVQIHHVEPHYFFGNDFVLQHTRHTHYPLFELLFKRVLDIAVSSSAILVLAVLAPLVFLLKRLEGSKTPVFYNGTRVGKNGRLFPCWKFCTMRTDGDEVLAELLATDTQARLEWVIYQKLKNDPRIDSRISAFLRKTSLDELPQLWNVFIGDMSLVGPRPILPSQISDYGDSLRHYTSVRPGLTGLWQVSGRNETTFAQRINWDGWYIRNWSVWNDMVILFKTVRVLFTGSGAY